jgi:hypothetical protein
MPPLLKRLSAAIGALGLALLLAACTISSEKPLVAPGEGAAPLPDSFTFRPYEASADGYVPSTDPPATFTRQDHSYTATSMPDMKGPLDVRFVPIGDEAYLMAVTDGDTPGMIYGFARYADSVLSVALIPDKQTAAAIAIERTNAMPRGKRALKGVAISAETDAITLSGRTALNYLAEMYVAGRLPMGDPSVAYLALDPEAPSPSRLVASGRHWIKVP